MKNLKTSSESSSFDDDEMSFDTIYQTLYNEYLSL